MKHNWIYKKLGEVCDLYQPKTVPQKDCLPDGKYPVYGSNGIIGYYNDYNHSEKEILIACRGTCGTVNVSKPYSWINGNAMVVHPFSDQLDFDFLRFQLMGKDMKDVITGATIPQITRQSLSSLLISIPPLSEQKSIVSELDLLQSIIDKQKAQLKELDNLAQAVFYDMFGDPIVNERGWKKKTLKDIGKIVTGNTPSRMVPDYYDPPFIEWIKSDNLSNDVWYATQAREYLSVQGAIKGKIVPRDSVLVTCIAGSLSSLGTASIVDRDVAFNQQINAIIPNQTIANCVFILHLIRNMGDSIRGVATTGMKHIITKAVFESVSIIVPPLNLQQSFAAKIEAIEKQKSTIGKCMEETQKLFDYTMDKYFG